MKTMAARKLNEFLENEDWVESAKILREEVEQMSRLKFGEYLTEDGHTDVSPQKSSQDCNGCFTEDEY